MSNLNQPRPRNNFDLLRIVLAIFVVFSHSFALGVGHELHEPLSELMRATVGRALTIGELAVDGFFVISGYLITMSWERRHSLYEFLQRRVARIYPGFIVATTICTFAIPYLAAQGVVQHVDIWAFIGETLRLRTVKPDQVFHFNAYPDVINGSLWSIPYEFWCYLGVVLLGLTGLLGKRRYLIIAFCLSLIAAYIFEAFSLTPGGGVLGEIFGFPPFWARLLPFYLAGVLAYSFRFEIHYTSSGLVTLLALCFGIALLTNSFAITLPVAWSYMVFYFAFSKSLPVIRATAYGDCSYGTYLYAFPIQQLCVMYYGGTMPPLLLFMISLPLSIFAGFLSWHFVEKWFSGKKKAVTSKLSMEGHLDNSDELVKCRVRDD